jgi:hypothetical protein
MHRCVQRKIRQTVKSLIPHFAMRWRQLLRVFDMSTIARHLGKPAGYSCQPWLATDIANRYFGSVYRAWFSTSLNPHLNGSSSNPLVLFQELDRIVHTNDFNHSRIDQLRRRLSNWVAASHLSSHDVAHLLAEIIAAPVPAFRPLLWKIDLRNIHVSRLVSLGQFPDEYQVRDLIPAEIEVLVP